MTAKFLLCAVFAIFAVQVLNAHPDNQKTIEDAIQEILRKVKEAIHQLVLKLEELGNVAADRIQAVIDAIKAKGQELVDQALKQIDDIEAAIQAKIQELVKLAADNGVDISECIAVAKPALEALKQQTQEELKSCVSEQVKQAEVIAQNVIALVKLGVAEAKQAGENLDQCLALEKPLQVIECLKREAVKATQEALRLIGLVGEELKVAEELAQQAATEIPACIARTLAQAQQSSAAILVDLNVCVKDKIDNKP